MKKTVTLLLALAAAAAVRAQQPWIDVKSVPGTNDLQVLLAEKPEHGTLSVVLNLETLENCSNLDAGIYTFPVRQAGACFLTLRSANGTEAPFEQHQAQFYRGVVNAKIDPRRVYRMPCSPLRARPVRRLPSEADPDALPGYLFPLEQGDTLYAMRSGTVIDIEIPDGAQDAGGRIRSATAPVIRVEHPDGTLACYELFDPRTLQVKEGDPVNPSTPLAIVGTYDGERYEIVVRLYRLRTNPKSAWGDDYVTQEYFLPRLRTTEGDRIPDDGALCTPLVDEALVTQEMSRREAKARRAK